MIIQKTRRLKFVVAEIENCIDKVTSFCHELLVHLTDKSYIINSQFLPGSEFAAQKLN